MTERLPFHFLLSCIGEGNGNPLQCFCLENPRDGGAWWASVYRVAQSQTRLKRLSSSSSVSFNLKFQIYPFPSFPFGSHSFFVLFCFLSVSLFLFVNKFICIIFFQFHI